MPPAGGEGGDRRHPDPLALPGDHHLVLDGVGEYMHLFTADRWEGEPACGDSDEGVLEWVPREKVPALPIWEGDKLFFRLLEEERPFFSLKLCYRGDTLVEAVLDGKKL